MKIELQAKYLQFMLSKKKNQNTGFTLIELLVVIIIIGILSAIALPSFLNQTAKARGAEAKTNVGSMNRAQQAYFLEQQTFTTDIDELGLGMDNSTDNFTYSAEEGASGIRSAVVNQGKSIKDDIKSYTGGVFYTPSNSISEGFTTTILCEANNSDDAVAVAATTITSNSCGNNARPVEQ